MERAPLLDHATDIHKGYQRKRSPAPSYRTIEMCATQDTRLPSQYTRAIEIGESEHDIEATLTYNELQQACREVIHQHETLIRALSHYPNARLRNNDIETGADFEDDVVIGGWKYICVGFSALTVFIVFAFMVTIWVGILHE